MINCEYTNIRDTNVCKTFYRVEIKQPAIQFFEPETSNSLVIVLTSGDMFWKKYLER